MSRSVLVMDTPESCDKCKIRAINLAWCNVARKSTSHYTNGKPIDERKRPNWCPLRELPAKREVMGIPRNPRISDFERAAHQRGWNACIKQMEVIDE